MRRGLHTISQVFISDKVTDKGKPSNKGIYTDERDECILYRYYYYCQLKQIRFDVALTLLEKEFFIGSSTLTGRITANNDKLKDIITEKRSVKDLKKKYPHLNWN